MPAEGPKYDFAEVAAPGTVPKIHSIFDFTAESLEQLAFWLEQRGLHIPVTQLLGFQQFTTNPASTITAPETTTSTSYGDLSTTGPTLTGLSDGVYEFRFGCQAFCNAASQVAAMALAFNGSVDANPEVRTAVTADYTSISASITKTLANGGNNTVAAKYKSGNGGTVTFAQRWLVATRYANT